MKKKILSIFSLIVAFVFIFVNVNATEITTDSSKAGTTDTSSYLITNTGELKVTNVTSGDAFSAYKVLDGFYNSTSNTLTYEFTDSFKAFLSSSETYSSLTVDEYVELTSGDITSGKTTTTSTLDKLVSSYASYVKQNSVSGTAMTVSGTDATLTCAVGAYLILPTSTSSVYAVMVGNVSLTTGDDGWEIDGTEIVAKVSQASVSVVTKSSTDTADTNSDNDNSYNTDETYTNTITATVPQYPTNATNTTYTITIDVADGATFTGVSDVVISSGDTTYTNTNGTITDSNGNTVATVTYTDGVVTISVDPTYAGTTLTIAYNEYLDDENEDLVIGGTGNVDKITLTYSNDPYGTGTTTADTTATARTYGLKLYKVDKDDNTKKLSGAVFDVYSDSSLTKKIATLDATDADNGVSSYIGLKEGTFYLKEVTAPTGYKTSSDTFTVIIGEAGEADSTTGYYKTTIENEKSSLLNLPVTGGSGVIFYSLLGLLIIIIGMVAYIVYRKNKNQESN